MFGKIIDFKKCSQHIDIVFEKRKGRIEIITHSIINVFSDFQSQEHRSKAVEKLERPRISFEVEREDDCIVIRTDKVITKVYDEFKVDFYQSDGLPLCKDWRGKREYRDALNSELVHLMAKEGHQLTEEGGRHLIEVVKELDGDECFYGLGDKTGFLNKKGYAYEMWNTDNPEPQVDSFTRLYKSIPFLIALKHACSYGIFFDNTYHTYFDMGKESSDYYHFAADDGNLDYYFIAGDDLKDIVRGYTYLTGTVPLPQLWTLGYHQSRWGYETEKEVRELAANMRNNHIPCDTIHLDIDYMDRYKVFTWNATTYDNPKKMIQDLSLEGFKIVTIIDPGVKVEDGYSVYEEGKKKNYFATTPDGEIYVNQVWPGDSVYPDFGKPDVRRWWADNQKFLVDMGVRGVWNDMNEPASFQGEIPNNIVFYDEECQSDHAQMHNVYGHLMSKATYDGLRKYDKRRPFVITRACYAGSQKYATGWTGDNHSIWAHLQMAIPQICNLGLSGMAYVGTDVGGFGSDTTPELLVRWVQVGCFSPLFRNHASKGSRCQEPWQFDKITLDIYRKYVELRYRILPYFYDLYFTIDKTGLPIMRPLVLHYEKDEEVHHLNDEFMVGENIVVAPVVTQGTTKRLVYLPEGSWIDYWTKEKISGKTYIIKDAPIDVCPVYIKAGTILPNYPAQEYIGEVDITELILDIYKGNGKYTHFQDDGETFNYQNGAYNQYMFSIDQDGVFTAELCHAGYEKIYKTFHILYCGKSIKVSFQGEKIVMVL